VVLVSTVISCVCCSITLLPNGLWYSASSISVVYGKNLTPWCRTVCLLWPALRHTWSVVIYRLQWNRDRNSSLRQPRQKRCLRRLVDAPGGRPHTGEDCHRINRLAVGNFGDCKLLRQGVCELRIDWGPGDRFYYAIIGRECVFASLRRRQAEAVPDTKRAGSGVI
jgi:putative addiction module killer protein